MLQKHMTSFAIDQTSESWHREDYFILFLLLTKS